MKWKGDSCKMKKEDSVAVLENRKQKSLWQRFTYAVYQHKYLYLLLIPGLIYFILFAYMPMYGVIIAFREFSYRNPFGGEWVGLQYFKEMMDDAQFWEAFRNTLEISFGRLIFEFPFPIILALALNELRGTKFKRIAQTVFTFPHFLSWVIGAGIVTNILADSGVLNQILSALGLEKVSIMTNPVLYRPMLYITNIWKECGWSAIMYMAAIASINPEYYEAAYLDGANRFQRMWYITVPCISGTISVLLIMAVGNACNAGFDQIFNTYNSMVYDVGDILDTYIYRRTFVTGMGFSSSAAQGLFKSVINLVLLVAANTITKKISNQGIY